MLKPDLVKEAHGLPFIAFLRGWSEGQGGRQTAPSLTAGATGCQQGYKTSRCWAPRKDGFPPRVAEHLPHHCCVNHPKSTCVLRRTAALFVHSLGKEDDRRDQEEKADIFLSDPAVNPRLDEDILIWPCNVLLCSQIQHTQSSVWVSSQWVNWKLLFLVAAS